MVKNLFSVRIVFLSLILLVLMVLISGCSEIKYENKGGQSIKKTMYLSDGGNVNFSVTVGNYDGNDGKKYLQLRELSYSVGNSPEFKNVEVNYCDGKNTYKESSDQFSELYEVDADIVPYENHNVKATLDVYLDNGEKHTVELP